MDWRVRFRNFRPTQGMFSWAAFLSCAIWRTARRRTAGASGGQSGNTSHMHCAGTSDNQARPTLLPCDGGGQDAPVEQPGYPMGARFAFWGDCQADAAAAPNAAAARLPRWSILRNSLRSRALSFYQTPPQYPTLLGIPPTRSTPLLLHVTSAPSQCSRAGPTNLVMPPAPPPQPLLPIAATPPQQVAPLGQLV
jgi:hypothetical protein